MAVACRLVLWLIRCVVWSAGWSSISREMVTLRRVLYKSNSQHKGAKHLQHLREVISSERSLPNSGAHGRLRDMCSGWRKLGSPPS